MMKSFTKFSKLSIYIFTLVSILTILSCSSEVDSKPTETMTSTENISLDPSLDTAIDKSLSNYQSVIIVFYRGYFWGICRAQLGELSQNHELFKRFGIDVITVSTDDQENTDAMRDDVNANFSMVSDNTYTISQKWKVFNVLGDGVSAPAAFIVGKNKEILWSHIGSTPNDRPPTDYLLAKTLELLKKTTN